MSVISRAFSQAAFAPASASQRPAVHPQVLFAGEAEDKFVSSKKTDSLTEAQAAKIAHGTYGPDLVQHYMGRLDILHQMIQDQVQFLKETPLHPTNNPQALSYFDLLQLIQEKSDEHPQRFLKDVSMALMDLQQKASKSVFSFNRNISSNQLSNVQKTWDDKQPKGCSEGNLRDVMGQTERAYLPINLKRLEAAKMIDTRSHLLTGRLNKFEGENDYYNAHETGITLTRLGKAVLNAENDNVEELVNMLIPSHDPWTSTLASAQEDETLRKTLISLVSKSKPKQSGSSTPAVAEQSTHPTVSSQASSSKDTATASEAKLIDI